MKSKSNRFIKLSLGIILLLAVVVVLLIVLNLKNEYSIELATNKDAISFEYGDEVKLPEIEGKVYGSIFHKSGKNIKPAISDDDNDFSKLGEHRITYTYKYKGVAKEASVIVYIKDTTAPVITLKSDKSHFTSPIASYEEEGYSAIDNYDGDITTAVESREDSGFVYYTVIDSSGNRADAKREIIYKDEVPPEIVLEGGEEIDYEASLEFIEPGFSAIDDCDGDISDAVEISGEVDTTVLGEYVLTYSVKDSYDNECSVERKVNVVDTTGPSLSISGGLKQFVLVDSEFNPTECIAIDFCDGDCSESVEVSGEVDTSKAGIYELIYSASDSLGNKTEEVVEVYVCLSFADIETINPGEKVVYLTFDDGPGPYTEKLLDILDKYNVKVTFFVTNQSSGYQDMIGEEYRRGHTVAIHSYSHSYSNIYSSEEAYIADLTKMSDIIKDQTGETPRIIRFPGGSSNTVSASYSKGIVRALANTLGELGYKYADWNVSSGDAGGAIESEKVVSNVTKGIAANSGASIVLQHDVHEFSVDAVEDIIIWGLENGYTFLPMDLTSPMAHHRINN